MDSKDPINQLAESVMNGLAIGAGLSIGGIVILAVIAAANKLFPALTQLL